MTYLSSHEALPNNLTAVDSALPVESGGGVRQPGRFLRTALALALTAGLGGALVDCGGKSAPRPAAATQAQPKTPESTPSSTASTPPYDGTEPTLGGKYYSAGKYDPTTPVAIPYVAGQKPTKAIVETLFRDVDVAITSNDVNQLLYAGIDPTSELAQNIQAAQMASFESNVQQAGALTHVFNETLDDRDIQFDATDPTHAKVLVQNGSDFDLKYAPNRVTYREVDMRLGHKVITLPNGQSEDIWRVQYQLPSNATFDQWLTGYPQ